MKGSAARGGALKSWKHKSAEDQCGVIFTNQHRSKE